MKAVDYKVTERGWDGGRMGCLERRVFSIPRGQHVFVGFRPMESHVHPQ